MWGQGLARVTCPETGSPLGLWDQSPGCCVGLECLSGEQAQIHVPASKADETNMGPSSLSAHTKATSPVGQM